MRSRILMKMMNIKTHARALALTQSIFKTENGKTKFFEWCVRERARPLTIAKQTEANAMR